VLDHLNIRVAAISRLYRCALALGLGAALCAQALQATQMAQSSVTRASGGGPFSSPHIKDDLPCVAELCLGDGLDELSDIPWELVSWRIASDPSTTAPGGLVDESILADLEQRFAGDLTAAAPYLISLAFDADAIPRLSTVICATGYERLYGRYISRHGNPTQVAVALVQKSAEDPRQVWTVVEITREMIRAESAEDVAAVRRTLAARYENWVAPLSTSSRPKSASFEEYFVGHPIFTLTLTRPQHQRTPGFCGASAHTEVD
jgi:hypothetical protein